MVMAAIMASVPLSASALLTPTSLPPPKRSSLPRNSCSIAPHLISSSSSSRKLSSYSASTSYLSSGQIGSVRCRATGEGSQSTFDDRMVYQGVYGPWTVDPADIREVILYRLGLITAAASFVISSSAAFIPEGNILGDIIKQDVDFLYIIGAGGLGLSLLLIHIYVTPIKRFLQSLWVLGVIGSVGTYIMLAKPLNQSLIEYVISNPVGVWFIGPLFAALTGVVFKEGLCYGKLEAGILTFIIPGLLLGHLTGFIDDGAKLSLLGTWMALFMVFAARKFQQPIKDDIGDKSIFMFNALPEKEKKALLQNLDGQLE